MVHFSFCCWFYNWKSFNCYWRIFKQTPRSFPETYRQARLSSCWFVRYKQFSTEHVQINPSVQYYFIVTINVLVLVQQFLYRRRFMWQWRAYTHENKRIKMSVQCNDQLDFRYSGKRNAERQIGNKLCSGEGTLGAKSRNIKQAKREKPIDESMCISCATELLAVAGELSYRPLSATNI